MLFFSYFKDLVGREVTVELKNDLAIRGTLHSVKIHKHSYFLRELLVPIFLVRKVDSGTLHSVLQNMPCQYHVRNCFIRGSVVRYVQLPPEGVDIELLHDATRREARGG
ncbi:hypothetical protein V6Z12_A11G133800 [Gossypium hirsutum]